MGVELSDEVQALLKDACFCYIATVMPNGAPQMTVVWVDTDGEHILINTIDGNRKVKNLEKDDRVALVISKREDPAEHVQIRGRVVEIVRDGAKEHVETLSQRYIGMPYPLHKYGERAILKIEPTRVREMLAGISAFSNRPVKPA